MGRVVPAGHWKVTDCMDMIPFTGKDSGCSGEMRKAKRKDYVSWTTIEAEIGALILTGDYYQPVIKEDIEPDYEEEDEVIDAEYREILEEEEMSLPMMRLRKS